MTRRSARRAVVASAVAASTLLAACGSATHAARSTSPSVTTAATRAATTTTRPGGPSVTVTTAPWKLRTPVSRAAVMADGDTIVIAGGITTGDHSIDAITRLDPATGTIRRAGSLAQAVHDTGGVKLGDAFFVFGGGAASTYATVQRFTTGDAVEAAALPKARSDHNVVAAGTVAYVVAGFDGKSMDGQLLSTADGKTFTPVGTLVQPVRYGAAAVAGGALWVVGGSLGTTESSKGATFVDTIQRFDPRTGTTTVVGHLPERLSHACAFAMGDDLYVVGGRTGAGPSDQILRIDTTTGSVTTDAGLPASRTDAGVVVIGATAWVIGGETTDAAHPLDSVLSITARG